MDLKLKGKRALITGGTRGIGRAICEKLAAPDTHVFINYASAGEAAEETAKTIVTANGAATPYRVDITDTAQVAALMDDIKRVHGRLRTAANSLYRTRRQLGRPGGQQFDHGAPQHGVDQREAKNQSNSRMRARVVPALGQLSEEMRVAGVTLVTVDARYGQQEGQRAQHQQGRDSESH